MSVLQAVIEAPANALTQVHAGDTIDEPTGTHFFVRGDEVVWIRAPGAGVVTLEVNPSNPWGRVLPFTYTFTAINEIAIIDLKTFAPEMIIRQGVSEAGAILLNASVVGFLVDCTRAAPLRG